MKEGGKMLPMYDEKINNNINLPYKLAELTSIQVNKFFVCFRISRHVISCNNYSSRRIQNGIFNLQIFSIDDIDSIYVNMCYIEFIKSINC